MAHLTFPVIKNDAPVISRLGGDDVFVELSYRREGEMVELVITRVEYDAFSGRYLRDEIDSKTVHQDDAPSIAGDMEWKAADRLDETGDRGYADPLGFEDAVIAELTRKEREADRAAYMRIAIAHNAAMIAAE